MFSINLATVECITARENPLHSTMFSINQSAYAMPEPPYPPLHSTMFSINLSSPRDFRTLINLYIPLCFLLIWSCADWSSVWRDLYIPLCFLLISIVHYFPAVQSFLYIPLCFLLILKQGQGEINYNTLHSTMFSINPGEPERYIRQSYFTFHYVFY